MTAFGYLVLLVVIASPVAWLVAEFKGSRSQRVTLGIVSLLASFGVAWLAGSLVRLNYNAWYGEASKDLVDSVVREIEAGRVAETMTVMKQLQQDFQPTYENRAHYDALVKAAVARMRKPTK